MRKKLLRSTPDLRHHIQGGLKRNIESQCQGVKNLAPFTRDEWSHILNLVEVVDHKISSQHIPVFVGSEPTFVSLKHHQEPEWNNRAIGKSKLKLAKELAENIKTKMGENTLLIHEFAKWCAGEEWPRWAFSLYSNFQNPFLIPKNKKKKLSPSKEGVKMINLMIKMIRKNLILNLKLSPIKIDSACYLLPASWDTYLKKWKIEKEIIKHKNIKDIFKFKKNLDFGPNLYVGPLDLKKINKYPRLEMRKMKGKNKICIFIPKIEDFDAAQEFINSILKCADQLNIEPILQGFGPPPNPKIKKLSITPDPGVLEINLPPFQTSLEIFKFYDLIDQETKALGLFPYREDDYTGGGNHITIGGIDTAHNPFIQKPDLLLSFLNYWQHHPALSYLFSGYYVGPTSQAPRVDENLKSSFYEYEIALQEFKKLNQKLNHELINKLYNTLNKKASNKKIKTPDFDKIYKSFFNVLKTFLVDVTGNTHRSEFCIDKFYHQDGPYKDIGILELRGFEMQPHTELNQLMILFIMTLFCRFWDRPFLEKPKNLKPDLHDGYMLPDFIWNDLTTIVEECQQEGYPIKLGWFRSFFEIKFKKIGVFEVNDLKIEIRKALEFCPVIGSEMLSGLASRTVDPAVSRLQFKVSFLENRNNSFLTSHAFQNAVENTVFLCNGVDIPMGKEGVIGIRYKAEEPHTTAHPSIPKQTPLKFDVIDKSKNAVILSFLFDGKNIVENKGNHEVEIRKPKMHPDYPYTLDLRYQ